VVARVSSCKRDCAENGRYSAHFCSTNLNLSIEHANGAGRKQIWKMILVSNIYPFFSELESVPY
jgi:hypothetical protein